MNNIHFLVFILVIVIILIILIIDEDRTFNDITQNNAYPIVDYYWNKFPLPLLGLYNTIIRISHPSHTHYFDSKYFNSIKIIEENFSIIQKEALNIYNKKKTMNMKDIGSTFFDSIDEEKDKWKIYVIKWYDKINNNSIKNCPETCKIISQLDDVHVAMFSILEPGKVIIPHKGPSTACLRYHLGLKIPKDNDNCYIMVNDEKFIWKEGEGMIFDDTYVHSVYNNTNETRIILFIDIERPLMFPFNHINKSLISLSPFTKFVDNVNKNVEEKSSITKELFTV